MIAGAATIMSFAPLLGPIIGAQLANTFGWRAAFTISAGTALIAWLMVALVVPWRAAPPPRAHDPKGKQAALFDFRPVVRNTSAFAYSVVYCVHTLEMSALRGWGCSRGNWSPRAPTWPPLRADAGRLPGRWF